MILTILAQATVPAATSQPHVEPPWYASPQFVQLFPLIVLGVLFFMLMNRSSKTKEKKRTEMLSQLKRGDRVQTIGGILGTVVEARDTEVVLKVDEGSNTKIRFSRNAIHRVLEEEAAEAK